MERVRRALLRWLGLAAIVAMVAVAAGVRRRRRRGRAAGGTAGRRADAARRRAGAAGRGPAPPAEEPAPATGGLGSEFDVASAGDVTLELWWLGDLEAPGHRGRGWTRSVAMFQEQYPNVTVKPTLYETRHLDPDADRPPASPRAVRTSGTTGAAPGRSSPRGRAARCRTRTSSRPADIAANPHAQETLWEGKTWDFPLYQFVYPIVYNKSTSSSRPGSTRRRRRRPGRSSWRPRGSEGRGRHAVRARSQGRVRR